MNLQSPLIDSRTQDQILANIQALALTYTPEWDATQSSGAGAALMEIFADFVDGIIQRLNEAPNNNLIAFLNMLGVQLLPAQPALVPLTFFLSSGAKQSVTIPERSQAAANPPGGSPIVFETQAAIVATPASLQAVLSVVPETLSSGDLILNNLAGFQSGQSSRLFDPANADLQAHYLYLGDSNLFNLTTPGATIVLQLGGSANVSSNAEWSYSDVNGAWTTLDKGVDASGNLTLTKNGDGQIQQAKVNGVQSRWIRAQALLPKKQGLAQISLTSIGVNLTPPTQPVAPDAAFANDVPLPPPPTQNAAWFAFGTLPRQGDSFYIASQEAFSKPGANVTLSFTLVPWPTSSDTSSSDATLVARAADLALTSSAVLITATLPTASLTVAPPATGGNGSQTQQKSPPPAPNLSWEYWNGTGWNALNATDNTGGLLNGGDVTFAVPTDLAQTAVAGNSSMWIRVRLASGDYGQIIYTAGTPADATGVHYPIVSGLTVSYQTKPQTPANVMTFNNGSYQIYTPDSNGFYVPGVQPFIPLDDVSQALYLGFNQAPLDGPISIFFDLVAQAYPPGSPRLEWQYYGQSAGQASGQWNRLTIVDGTQGLTQSGTVQFIGPADFAQLSRYGYNLFWIRAVDVTNSFQQPVSWLPSATPLPTLTLSLPIVISSMVPVRRLQTTSMLAAAQIAARTPALSAASFSAARAISSAPPVVVSRPDLLRLPVGAGLIPTNPTVGLPSGIKQFEAKIEAATPCAQQGSSFSAAFQGSTPSTSLAPKINNIYLNTAWAIQAETITGETLGSSDASQNQQYQLTKFPVVSQQIEIDEFASLFASERAALAADKSVTTEQVTDANGNVTQFWVEWTPIDDLSTAGPNDRVYAIDPTFGTIQFGDGVTGMVPPVGFNNVQATYQYGGGSSGNVAAATITTLRTTIPLVDHVNNPLSAGGGSDTEELNSAVERGTEGVKNRGRAVSVEDYQWLAFAASRDVARVLVLPDFNDAGQSATNWVTVLIVPGTSDPRPYPSFELQQIVQNSLLACAPCVTTAANQIRVSGPTYVEVDVSADVYAASISQAAQLETAAVTALQAFLHPLTGGPSGQGWDFGTLPCLSDFYGLLGALPGVDHIEGLSMNIYVVNPDGSGAGAPTTIDQSHPFNGSLPPYVLIASGNHSITIQLSSSGSLS